MGAAATGTPLLPSSYVAGTITISAGQAGTPQQLLALIQAQLDANCPGVAYILTIQADASNPVYIGRQTPLGGALSTTNYGVLLDKAQSPLLAGANKVYQSAFPGSHAPIGDIQVLMSGAGNTFHVEVIA